MTTTLLAVDDSVTMRKVLEITFAGENFKTLLASSADEALAIAKREKPAIALLDHTLDGGTGYDLARDLKSAVPGLAVILLSSKQNPFDKAKASATGVDDFMDKPFDTQKLLDKVTQVLSAPRAAAAPVASAPVQAQPIAAAAAARPRTQTSTGGYAAPVAAAPAPVAAAPKISAAPNATPKPVVAAPAPAAQPAVRPAAVAQPAPVTPKPAAAAAAVASVATAVTAGGSLPAQLEALGLTKDQIQGVLALSREVVEKVVWEVVPVLAETLIKEEIARLTSA